MDRLCSNLCLSLLSDGAESEDEDIVNTGNDIYGFKTPKRKSTMRTPLKTPTSVAKQRLYKTPNKTPLKTPDKVVKAAQTPQTVRRKLRNSMWLNLLYLKIIVH